MLYDTMARPPKPGSLLEILFTMVQMKREAAQLMETRVIVQAMRDESDDGDVTQKAFEDYRRALLPYTVGEERKTEDNVIEAMNQEFNAGPMRVKPMENPSAVRSKLSRIVRQLKEVPKPELRWRRKEW